MSVFGNRAVNLRLGDLTSNRKTFAMISNSLWDFFGIANVNKRCNPLPFVAVGKPFGMNIRRHILRMRLDDVTIDCITVFSKVLVHELDVGAMDSRKVSHGRVLSSGDYLNACLIVFVVNSPIATREDMVP